MACQKPKKWDGFREKSHITNKTLFECDFCYPVNKNCVFSAQKKAVQQSSPKSKMSEEEGGPPPPLRSSDPTLNFFSQFYLVLNFFHLILPSTKKIPPPLRVGWGDGGGGGNRESKERLLRAQFDTPFINVVSPVTSSLAEVEVGTWGNF